MNHEDIAKTAFNTVNCCFTFKQMIFSLSKEPSAFQKPMNKILRPSIGKRALVYLDDNIVIAVTFEKHLELLRKVFTLLRNDGLTVKLENYKFLRRELKNLGVTITQDGINYGSEKTESITFNSPPPLKIVSKMQRS